MKIDIKYEYLFKIITREGVEINRIILTLNEIQNRVFTHRPKDLIAVREFTGIKNVNGGDIYNGDILDIEFGEASFLHRSVEVYWNEEFLQYCVRGGNLTTRMVTSLAGYVKPKYIVKGNIYENPELIK